MLKRYICALIIYFLFSTPVFAEKNYVPGEVVVKFKSPVINLPQGKVKALSAEISTEISYIDSIIKKYGLMSVEKAFTHLDTTPGKRFIKGRFVEMPDLRNIYVFLFSEDSDVDRICDELTKDPNVEYASKNPIRKIFLTPDDPYFHDYPASFNQWGLYKISAEAAWDIETGDDEIIAVIDTGVRSTHEDLSGKVISGYNFFDGNANTNDVHGHGTHVSGIIGAIGNNGVGIAGVDWGCKILPIRIFSPDLEPWTDSIKITSGIIFAADNFADVINMSFGGPGYTTLEAAAIKYAYDAGCVLVAAAGNYTGEIKQYPAAFTAEVMAVAATTIDDTKTDYSAYGNWVDISAPGGDGGGYPSPMSEILSSYYYSDFSYEWMSGTSMAAPFVSGLAGLLRAQNPGWTNTQIEEKIMATADPIDSMNPGYEGKLGAGRINAYTALSGLPFARIHSPYNNSVVYGNITILGTATGEGFSFYRVSTGEGANPAVWTDLVYSTSPKLNETLATWNTSGLTGLYSIRVIVNDIPTIEAKVSVNAGSPYGVTILGSPLNGPNPFSPIHGSTTIYYKLSTNADITLFMFDISGSLVWKRRFSAGIEEGGKQGDNKVVWNGFTDFGEIASNGVYVYKIVARNNVIGKGKIIVLK
ncbi:MAG: S8 family serine peptidase [Candidatus Saganbacteria bacterium]|nr:S8 family serine peptidase [Candidatus Saganbacteria bacterium]